MAETPTTQSPLFSALAAKYGIRGALALLPLLDSNASTKSKAIAGTSLAGSGAQLGGNLAGSPGLASLGTKVGQGLGLASGAYGAYSAATDKDLKTTQRVGHSGQAVADTLMGVLVPYYGLAKAASIVGQVLQGSESPQVRGAGRAVDQAAEPAGAKAFWNVARGDKSPGKALRNAGTEGLVTDLLGPVGALTKGLGVDGKVARNIMDFGPLPFAGKGLRLLGVGADPTTGNQFRDQVRQLFDRIPELKGTDTGSYNMAGGVDAYNAFSPEARSSAEGIARSLGPLSSVFAKQDAARQQAYIGQISNILLNRFGNQMPAFR